MSQPTVRNRTRSPTLLATATRLDLDTFNPRAVPGNFRGSTAHSAGQKLVLTLITVPSAARTSERRICGRGSFGRMKESLPPSAAVPAGVFRKSAVGEDPSGSGVVGEAPLLSFRAAGERLRLTAPIVFRNRRPPSRTSPNVNHRTGGPSQTSRHPLLGQLAN